MNRKTFFYECLLIVFPSCKAQQSTVVLHTTFEERAELGDVLFLCNTKWLQLFAQEIFNLASLSTDMSKAQSRD